MLKLNLKRRDLVLEVGSGDFPNIYSDVLVDKYPQSNQLRNFDLKRDSRPFIAAAAEALPFKDKAFDYCISAHTVTYSDSPEKFFAELTRIAPRGLLILPNELHERLYDTPYHRWFINYVEGKLIFRPKRITDSFGRFFHLLYRQNPSFRSFQDANPQLFYIIVEWKDKIIFEVQRDRMNSSIDLGDERQIGAHYPLKPKPRGLLSGFKKILPNSLKYFLLKSLITLSRFPRPKINIDEIIVCPLCHQGLKEEKEGFVCFSCKLKFPRKGDIPYLLADSARKINPKEG